MGDIRITARRLGYSAKGGGPESRIIARAAADIRRAYLYRPNLEAGHAASVVPSASGGYRVTPTEAKRRATAKASASFVQGGLVSPNSARPTKKVGTRRTQQSR